MREGYGKRKEQGGRSGMGRNRKGSRKECGGEGGLKRERNCELDGREVIEGLEV